MYAKMAWDAPSRGFDLDLDRGGADLDQGALMDKMAWRPTGVLAMALAADDPSRSGEEGPG